MKKDKPHSSPNQCTTSWLALQASMLPLIDWHDHRAAQGMEEQVKAQYSWCGVGGEAQGGHINCMDHGKIAVRSMAFRGRCTNVASKASIVTQVESTCGQAGVVLTGTCASGQAGDADGDIRHSPVPVAAGSGSIWIIDGNSKALGACGKIAPGELWGDIFAARSQNAADLCQSQSLTARDIRTGNGKCRYLGQMFIWIVRVRHSNKQPFCAPALLQSGIVASSRLLHDKNTSPLYNIAHGAEDKQRQGTEALSQIPCLLCLYPVPEKA